VDLALGDEAASQGLGDRLGFGMNLELFVDEAGLKGSEPFERLGRVVGYGRSRFLIARRSSIAR
jgi:hypothetical protein